MKFRERAKASKPLLLWGAPSESTQGFSIHSVVLQR